jgi:photosystem II stability/assembly factor-like uncharacterized protein
MRVPFECTEADTQAASLSCSEEEPCPVFLELSNVEAAGNKIFLVGNLHTPTTTLYSILLATDDAGKTWSEPHPRMRIAGLDQIQFIDFQNGWISGANLQSTPRDPFLLLTTDGGKTWHERPIFDETRVAVIERFWFESRDNGALLIDARLDNNLHEFYETRTGGESWSMKQASASVIPFPQAKEPGASGWRVRADAATHSFDLDKSDGARWQKVASFVVTVGVCKQ